MGSMVTFVAFTQGQSSHSRSGHNRQLTEPAQLFIIYFVLAVIRRYTYDFKIKLKSKGRRAEGSLAPTPAVAHSGSDDEFSSDLSDGARTNFIDHMASAVSAWRTVLIYKRRHYERFRGPDEARMRLPRDGVQDGIYKECLSREWAQSDPEHQAYYNHVRSCPEEFTIFALDVPLKLIPEDDQGWLADSEDEGEVSDEGAEG